jgi:hypothetical protein
MLANDGLSHHADGGNLGDVERLPLRWRGNEFTLEYKRPDKPKLMRHETNLKGRISADDRTIETLEIEDVFYYEHLTGRMMEARLQLKARNLPLQPGHAPGSLKADISGPAVKAALTAVRWAHSHYGTHGLEYYEPSPRFVIVGADGAGSTRALTAGTLSIGRSADNDIVFALAEVSGHHAELVLTEDRLVVRDLGSRNGTFVGGRPVREMQLRVGDVVRIGGGTIRVE